MSGPGCGEEGGPRNLNVNDLCSRGIGERHDDAHSSRCKAATSGPVFRRAWLACLSLRALLASTQHPPPVKLQIVAAMPHTLPSRAGLTSADVEGFALLACGWLGVEGLGERSCQPRCWRAASASADHVQCWERLVGALIVVDGRSAAFASAIHPALCCRNSSN